MDTEIVQAVKKRPVDARVSSIKEKMSIAYMHGINSTVNYVFSDTNKDFDGIGIDLRIRNKVVGEGRTVSSESNEINVQLKGVSVTSTSMITQTDTTIRYKLNKSLQPYGTHYLIIVVLPEESELVTWRGITSNQLTLRACAYFIQVKTLLKPGYITIPKANILTHDSYIGLFDAAAFKDSI